MANTKISALTASTTPLAGTEVLPIVQSSATVKVSVANLTAGRAVSAASLSLTTTPLSVANGGTGLTTLATGLIPYGNGTGALSSSSNFSLDTSGNLLIGTTSGGVLGSNSMKLVGSGTVKPVAYFENTQSNGNLPYGVNMVLTNDANNNVSYFYQGQGGAVTRFVVYATGNVQNTNNSYGAISDIKLKQNISLSNSQWNDVKALSQLVKKFSLISDSNNTMQIGWIAQDVQAISPGLVYAIPDIDKDGNKLETETLSIQHSVAYMKAFKALGEALIRIEQLEARLTAANIA
jgi:hypothetical protein